MKAVGGLGMESSCVQSICKASWSFSSACLPFKLLLLVIKLSQRFLGLSFPVLHVRA